MRHLVRRSSFVAIVILLGFAGSLGAQQQTQAHRSKTSSQVVLENWNYIGNKLITMAEDWPEDKYTYRLNSQVRTFQQVLLHVAGSNYGLLNQISGKKVGNGANDPSVDSYKTKAQTVAFLKKSVAEGAATIQKEGDAGVLKHLNDWIGYTEHMGEHYGLLVAYYRNNGVVPPDSRPKK
ncbi:MAG: DinB family protein [Candidatus Acidiferrales bacterium]